MLFKKPNSPNKMLFKKPNSPNKMLFRPRYIFLIVAVIFALNAYRYAPSFLYGIALDKDQLKFLDYPVHDSGIFKEVFQNLDVFLENYAGMEVAFKIFVYPNKDEDTSYYHWGIRGVFSSEKFFHYNLLTSDRYSTSDDFEANMFFISLTSLQISGKGVYASGEDYLRYIINEYPHLNRTTGVHHFFVTCHDDGASVSERFPLLNNSIAVLCSAHNDSGHGIRHKHNRITLPQIRLPYEFPMGGKDIHHRTRLAFWATPGGTWPGHPHQERFKTSKYCICYGESFLTRICITDSIHFGCVPVILYDNYELPFNDILDWTKFSVIIPEDDIDQMEQILEDISDSEFSDLHYNIVKVQKHFEWNSPPRKYDAFHMILYELWLRHLSISDDLLDF
ncbi:probable glycosyltransferase At5g03795 [Tripterygium wilfordii]|uniref:probable glycosyltransferase At5g03795 n=1 Tax=Tripterygium wilfordii TaxID=458696 RepID=UPI0018F86348|nr:probable glycosyltransferase At5g03795 [Tripterygium wilfordii]